MLEEVQEDGLFVALDGGEGRDKMTDLASCGCMGKCCERRSDSLEVEDNLQCLKPKVEMFPGAVAGRARCERMKAAVQRQGPGSEGRH